MFRGISFSIAELLVLRQKQIKTVRDKGTSGL